MENLKKGNRYWIFSYLAASAFLFWCVFRGFYAFTEVQDWLSALKSFGSVGAILAPLLTVIVNGLISPHWKSTFVYWKIHDPLPGSYAFSGIAKTDSRIDFGNLRSRLGSIPTEPAEQNTLWYKLYLKHQSTVQVLEAHRSWLLLRDITSASVIVFPVFSIVAVFGVAPLAVKIGYIGLLVAKYLVLTQVARNYGNRFVANVMAVESHVHN